MSATEFVRAQAASPVATDPTARAQTSLDKIDLPTIAQHMFALMLRNVSSDGFRFSDPVSPGEFSRPGCVIAAPSFPANTPGVNQDYVFNWVRDAAVVALELAAAGLPPRTGGGVQPLIDYVNFAQFCQANATPTLSHAVFTLTGQPRRWSEQSDGPALQTLAILAAFAQLDPPTQAIATEVIVKNLDHLLSVYREPTTNLWEEHLGLSFFARSVALRCLREITANTSGIPVAPRTAEAISWLETALTAHWNGSYYVTLLAPPAPGDANSPAVPANQGYDPNIDIVLAAVYGAVPYADPKLLATAARLRRQWADPDGAALYPINVDDRRIGIGPLFGRYPADAYDGDSDHPVPGGHPWALCTCNFAQLCYGLANEITQSQTVSLDTLSADFFDQVGVSAGTSPTAAARSLTDAGDAMLRAVIYHSDDLELSEQFDGTTGYEKSVRDLTWSYASFLSAVRTRTGHAVVG